MGHAVVVRAASVRIRESGGRRDWYCWHTVLAPTQLEGYSQVRTHMHAHLPCLLSLTRTRGVVELRQGSDSSAAFSSSSSPDAPVT